jgi:membrane dipeptidase
VTLPSLAAGNVKWCLGTIFTEPNGKDEVGYPAGDAAAAGVRGREQLHAYRAWEAAGKVRRWNQPGSADVLQMGILVEGADPIAEPDELAWWVSQGVVAIGLSWAVSSRYAGGNSTDDPLTDLGSVMVRAMDAMKVVHDVSHLSDRALAQLFRATDQPVIASHSNCRVLVDTDGQVRQRHLTDDTIREIGLRGGMIGVNVFSPFIIAGADRSRRATLDEWAAHVNRICDIHQSRAQVGLGTDMDGGFSAAMMPEGIDKPADLTRLAETLAKSGWNEAEIRGFACENWLRFWSSRSDSLKA